MGLAEVMHDDATCRIATARNLLVCSWRDASSLDQMRAVGRAARTMARRHRRGAGSLHFVAGGVPRFTEDVRKEAARIRADASLSILGVAEIILVGGLAGVAVRGFVSTVNLLSRAARPHAVFGDMRSAAAWLCPRLCNADWTWTLAEVTNVVDEVSSGHGVRGL